MVRLVLPWLLACGSPQPSGLSTAASDGGTTDAGATDGGTTDAGTADGGMADAGDADAGTTDAGNADAGTTDAGTTDGGTADAGNADDPVETIPAGDPAVVGLCSITLACGATIPDEGRIPCAMTVTDSDGDVYWDDHAGVETRGRSSADAPKHQYSVELWDADGNEASANLLGMGGESDWVLNGNYYDRALVRNPLAYDLFAAAADVGSLETSGAVRYAAEHRYCELTLDGTWLGIYSLMERVKRDDDRVDITADDGTGSSFVVKLHDSDYQHTNVLGTGGWKIVYPSDPDAAQRAGIDAWLDGFDQAALYHPNQLSDWIDIDSTVDLILLEELFKNNDAYYLSLILWKDLDGVMQWTPWDLDLSLGQPSYNDNENPETWVLYRPTLAAAFDDVSGFDDLMATRWEDLRAGPWATDQILARIDDYQAVMGADAIDHNFEVWPIEDIAFGDYLYPVSSYAEEDIRLRAWVEARAAWMDDNVGLWVAGP